MSLNICIDCNFEKKRCQCKPAILVTKTVEKNMLKKIWEKIKSWFWVK